MSFPTGATAILLLVCILSLLYTKCPAASTPAGEPFLFRCQKSRVPDAPIRFQGQGHGRPASYFHCNNGGGLTSATDRRVSPRFQYSVQSLSGYRFCLIVPYAAVRFDKRQKIIFHTSTILRSARFSRMQTTKKPHGYHKIAVWQKDDRIWKSPLKFYAQYYSILSGDCQALIIMELWRLSVVFCVTLWHMIHGSLTPKKPSQTNNGLRL